MPLTGKRMNKSAIVLAIITAILIACSDTTKDHTATKGEEIFFKEILHDYGEIEEDSNGSYSFTFRNTGEEPIIVNRVRSTCGCTIPEWPKRPIEPGESGAIAVKYNTSQRGSFLKTIYVYSTAANSPVKLQIKGKVIPTE